MQLTGAQILIQALIDQGTELIFGYPGGSVLNIYDALYEKSGQLTHIVTSHEQGAAHAADGYARSTGKTGVVLATSGPGATNLVTGIATAFHDSVPVVAITGNVTLDLMGRDSFQEVDTVGITNPVVKHNYIVQRVEDLEDIVRDAFVIANSGRKGPVLIDIPKDITAAKAEYKGRERFRRRPFPQTDPEQFAQAAQIISEAKKPLIYAGGGVTFSDSSEELMAFANKIDAPICLSMMGLSSVPVGCERYLGMIGMHGTATANTAATECDLLIAVGARFSDRVAGDRKKFAHNAAVIHIDVDQAEIYKNVRAGIQLVGHAGDCLQTLTAAIAQKDNREWMNHLLEHKAGHAMPDASSGENVNPRELVLKLHEAAGDDTIVVTDVGQHQMITAQYYPFSKPRTFLSSCGLGTMGYGMGAAVGAKFAHPDRPVALITGDGSFHMNMAELAVAVSNDLPIVVMVFNNGVLGMVYQWQDLFYKGRYSYTEINRKTDFVKLAEAFGAVGMRITKQEEILPVLKEAFACGKPCIVDCVTHSSDGVYPIIPPGQNNDNMIFSGDDAGRE